MGTQWTHATEGTAYFGGDRWKPLDLPALLGSAAPQPRGVTPWGQCGPLTSDTSSCQGWGPYSVCRPVSKIKKKGI